MHQASHKVPKERYKNQLEEAGFRPEEPAHLSTFLVLTKMFSSAKAFALTAAFVAATTAQAYTGDGEFQLFTSRCKVILINLVNASHLV